MTTIEPTKQKRTPRFKRVAKGKISLNNRDIEIIKHVHRYRFLTSKHITALINGNDQAIIRRLGLLYHAGYLDRPREQIREMFYGSNPMIYALGNKGADLLADMYATARAKIDWTTKNKEVGSVFLEHSLMVANFMVCLEVACQSKGIKLIRPEEVLEEMPAREVKSGSLFGWNVAVKRQAGGRTKEIKIGVIPDSVFGLEFKNGDAAYFFLEADRSNMPIVRSSFDKSSFLKKLLAYWQSYDSGLIKQVYGFAKPRVLTLTISQERINSMIAANKEIDPRHTGYRMFYFARANNFDVSQPENIFDKIWINGRQEISSLLD